MGIELGFQLLVLGHGHQLRHLFVVLHLDSQALYGLVIGVGNDFELIVALYPYNAFQIPVPGILHHIQDFIEILCLFLRHLPGVEKHPQGHEHQGRDDQAAAQAQGNDDVLDIGDGIHGKPAPGNLLPGYQVHLFLMV